MNLNDYISKINTLYKTGNAREHSYRGDLQNLIMAILPDVLVTNEPARVDCGAPDYVLTRKEVPIGYIEAKDIGVDLGNKTLKEQFDRYKAGLSNLIFTDYLDFHFYRDGEFVTKIAIATIQNGSIIAIPENFEQFTNLIKDFAQTISQTIKSPTKLAVMMAGKAKLMADVIEKSLNHDDEESKVSNLKGQMLSFKQMLIHDIDNKAFADIYAQTIAYGMFAARYHDPTLPTFSREEAATLIPKSNPFLRKLFHDIAGYDLDSRLTWIVDDLVTIFLASDVAVIMRNFGRSTKQEDPVVHFYETFLGEYNPALRKARGVWYTPQPVVNFIVRAVDDILKTEFGLKDGLADTSKTKIKVKTHKFDNRSKGKSIITGEQEIEKEVHRVQILDPATGTGTFLAEVVKHIHKKFEGQQGIWSKYVTDNLIPRLNGFELLMASYAMAHLKMDMLLTETGYKPVDDQRFKIFLTNSLEEASDQQIDLFNWLADEANQANAVKRETPVMVVIGNPPYSMSSSNKSIWIEKLTADYKKDLNEKSYNSLSDDYVKFIRFGQHFIDKNGEGILAYISNNSFIDGIIHRQMRKHLLESFDKIYILDLHGNAKKKEVCPDGSPDQNVFDIMQGVSINLFIKTNNKKKNKLGEIYQYDLQGLREFKYNFLVENSLKTIIWKTIDYLKPDYLYLSKDNSIKISYEKGVSIQDFFLKSSSGIQTEFDELSIFYTKKEAEDILYELKNSMENDFIRKYNYQSKFKKVKNAINDVNSNRAEILSIDYKIFNHKYCIYTGKTNGLMGRPRFDMMKNIINKKNVSICLLRSLVDSTLFSSIFVSKNLVDKNFYGFQTSVFPLYLYPDNNSQHNAFGHQERVPNLNMDIVKDIEKALGLEFVPELENGNLCYANTAEVRLDYRTTFAPIHLLDYIYAVLHSPGYREKYKEFLKIDFPRVPYPKHPKSFWKLVELGGQLRELHLLESPKVEKYITQYPEPGDNIVTKPRYEQRVLVDEGNVISNRFVQEPIGRVHINDTQYFDNVPEVAWQFYIGGYQPAQKWLKDRKDRELSYEDILHYQKMIVALTETDKIMKEIDGFVDTLQGR